MIRRILIFVFLLLPSLLIFCDDYLAEARRAYDSKDYVKAEKFWRLSAQSGDPEGQTRLGWVHELGPHRWRSLEDAVAWYEKAAAQNHPEALFALSRVYRDYPGWQDGQRSRAYLGEAAEAGHPEAVMDWADVLWFNPENRQDQEEACRWYALAEQQDDPLLALGAGRCLISGLDQTLSKGKDRAKAKAFFSRAAQAENPQVAAEAREFLAVANTEQGLLQGLIDLPQLPFVKTSSASEGAHGMRWAEGFLFFDGLGRPTREIPDRQRRSGRIAYFEAVPLADSWMGVRCNNLPKPPRKPKDGEPLKIPTSEDYASVVCSLVESTPGREVTWYKFEKGIMPAGLVVDENTLWFVAGLDLYRHTLGQTEVDKVLTGVVPEPVSPTPLQGHRQLSMVKQGGEDRLIMFLQANLPEQIPGYKEISFIGQVDPVQKNVNWLLADVSPDPYRSLGQPGATCRLFDPDNWLGGFAKVFPQGQGFVVPVVRNRVGCIKSVGVYDSTSKKLTEGYTLKRGMHCK